MRSFNFNKIYITNRTKEKAIELVKRLTPGLIGNGIEVLDWGKIPDVSLVVNTTSLGLNQNDDLQLDFKNYKSKKNSIFYDLIYNPKETKFLLSAKKYGFTTLNGLMMFVYQAAHAFEIWHKAKPEIDRKLITFIKND